MAVAIYVFSFLQLCRVCRINRVENTRGAKKPTFVSCNNYLWPTTTGKQCKVVLMVTLPWTIFTNSSLLQNGKNSIQLPLSFSVGFWNTHVFSFFFFWAFCIIVILNFGKFA